MPDVGVIVQSVLNLDTSRAPTRPAELLALALAVRDADPSDEASWLEWKSTLDWQSKGARVHVARAILGFANRMPDDAARHVEGHGFLLVGVESGAIPGVAALDPVDLDQQVSPFIGHDGPGWHPTFLTVEGQTVLIIDVNPPRPGDPIHVARKTSDGITDGWVLVRGKGGTKQATSSQLDALQRRLQVPSAKEQVVVAIGLVEPKPVLSVDFNPDAWLEAEEVRLLRALPNPSGLGAVPRMDMLATTLGQLFQPLPEERTEEEYRQEIADYITFCRDRFPRVLEIGASNSLQPVTIRAQNLTAKNLPELVVELHVAGAVEAINPDRVAIDSDDRLPPPPRKWGPRPNPALASIVGGYHLPYVSALPSTNKPRPQPYIENGGSSDIRFPAVDLRPHRSADLHSIVLLVHEPPGSVLQATWSATSSGVDGTAHGEFTIPVGETRWTVQDWAKQLDE